MIYISIEVLWEQVVIIDALRSPIGKYRGMYKNNGAKN